MEFSITKQNLARGLNQVSRLASGKMPLPILNNILIIVDSSQLTLSVTDLEIGIEVTVPAKVEKSGKFTVPARLLQEFIQSCPDDTLTGSVIDNATFSIQGEHTGVKIRGLDASEFPGLPFVDEAPTFHIQSKIFKEAIDKVVYAAAIDETRPVLAGVLFTGADQELTLAATDSYRLAERKVKLDTKLTKPCSAIVPKRTLSEISRLLSDETGDISVFVGDNQIQIRAGGLRIISRLTEGNYPNYHAIIPDGYQTRATIHTDDCVNSLKMAQLFAREAGNLVTLSLVPGKGMTVQSVASQRGEATSQFTAITEGDELTVAFNVKYLLDALAVIQAENVFLEFNGPDKAVIVRPANAKDYLALVMPLKLD